MKTLILSGLAFVALSLPAHALTALEIIQKSLEITQGDTSQGKMEMLIVKPKWQRKLVMEFWESRKGKKFFTRIIAPAKEKGTGSLKIDKSMWNYLPKIEKVMKIPPSLMLQPWLGSDFTNDDLVKEISLENDYTHQLLGEEVVEGIKTYKLELVPKPDVPVVWGKVHYFVDKERFLPVRQEYFSESGKLVKYMRFSEFKTLHNRYVPTRMEMVPVNEKNQKTVITYLEVRYNAPIDDEIFSLRNLKNSK
ncbi:outer membrane lipoprotein-sorting protein [bacterium (Candidatus Blackallbacteria) CG17_big_fil_post_rev_8_21_14_2_50_48_46]|uniref:Outer membrane lipoprotein-sorting protein n=1 Tax=bacterium (Candidatus Blackallbacteria) CG17_big_fil_post_rev_8_21_14_2_50_48_46 TaxID=2014261 RepID=A0A2M7G4A9_9BACT|nr:MAG: outer membrane lipoprotein-sorting protein [bacterium (Candidatus Blackallbacteria) CG18_big_fil_WC_8_21_14_2_50_49_26]PIW16718.1 MAG: outer membrane lipoprotein-sorting protein [bacterium (Candidatus Blackallbacteria) CG17_big_fil_post_rev_8_21_14_2_50_48_46]PIW46224.1 MAG: outer membrane lipoprotein-sorting protein [bacterium (Candidatus Blackallbacteria) CG13_big_fil_rev_8_21_14_2_50_49_14]